MKISPITAFDPPLLSHAFCTYHSLFTWAAVKIKPEKKFRPVQDLNPLPLWYWCSAMPTELFSGLIYFHYCSSSVHYCKDRFHIHVFVRSSHIWFPYILNHLWQTSVNLVDMFKFKMNFKSNSSKTGFICIEIDPQLKKIKIKLAIV